MTFLIRTRRNIFSTTSFICPLPDFLRRSIILFTLALWDLYTQSSCAKTSCTVLAHPGSPGQRAIKRVCVCSVYDWISNIVKRYYFCWLVHKMHRLFLIMCVWCNIYSLWLLLFFAFFLVYYVYDFDFNNDNTHTPFNGPLSGTTRVSWYQKGKNQSGLYWSKRERVAVASAGPYASLHLAPDR